MKLRYEIICYVELNDKTGDVEGYSLVANDDQIAVLDFLKNYTDDNQKLLDLLRYLGSPVRID